MKKKVIIFGPFDRFNYGDLLFPYMIEYAFNTLYPNRYEFFKYSLVEIDLEDRGGVKSKNYKELINAVQSDKYEAIIVAGGECLSARWDNLYSYISISYNFLREIPLMKRLLTKIPYARIRMGGFSEFPFVIDKSQFQVSIKVFYNAVGGGSNSPEVNKRLRNSTYVAVREMLSWNILNKNDVNSYLVPDSAIIMSDIYPINNLNNHHSIRDEIKEFLNSRTKYVFVQISKYKHQDSVKEIIEQLTVLHNDNRLEIVLCPIGTAGGHEDHIPLLEIFRSLNVRSKRMIDNPNVLEIMSLIANSDLYVGTSLHGIITSMSYGVPYLGLNKGQTKLEGYISTWGLKSLDKVQNPKDFLKYAQNILEISKDSILQQSSLEKIKYYNHIEQMNRLLCNESNKG